MTFKEKYGMSASDYLVKMGQDIAALNKKQKDHEESLIRPGRDVTNVRHSSDHLCINRG